MSGTVPPEYRCDRCEKTTTAQPAMIHHRFEVHGLRGPVKHLRHVPERPAPDEKPGPAARKRPTLEPCDLPGVFVPSGVRRSFDPDKARARAYDDLELAVART